MEIDMAQIKKRQRPKKKKTLKKTVIVGLLTRGRTGLVISKNSKENLIVCHSRSV
jgi:hypothetical protein